MTKPCRGNPSRSILGGPAPRAAARLPPTSTVRNHLPLGSLFGIRIWISRFLLWLVAFLLILGTLRGIPPWAVLLLVLGLAVVVLAHELGHSLVARRFGIRVSRITLSPIGGVAWMEEIPEDGRIEGLVAIAGPATNFAIAAITAPLCLIPWALQPVIVWFLGINLALGIFNLVPAFPMDGGRILRAFLARKGDYLRATEQAVGVAKYLALAMGVLGLVYGYWMVPLIAIYVWFMGQREFFSVRARALGQSWPFGAFTGAAGGQSPPRDAHGPAHAEGFGAGGTTGGFEARAPHGPEPSASKQPGRGFSDEEIDSLERYRGRLKREWKE